MSQDHSERTVTVVTFTEAGRTYPVDEAARLVSVHPDLLRHYCRIGLLGEAYVHAPSELRLDDTAIYWLRRLERVRRQHQLDRAVLPMLAELWRRIEHLEAEVRALRGA